MKKIFAIILTVALLFTMLPTGLFGLTASAATTSGTTGDCTWNFANGVLTISGKGQMDSYSRFTPAPWLELSNDITYVVIEEGVTNIGTRAFWIGGIFKDISIPSTVTSIGNAAFYGCAIKSITFPNALTEIGSEAFYGCSNLNDIIIPNNVSSIGDYAFYNCTNLKSVTFNTTGDLRIGRSAFEGCVGLTDITLPSNTVQATYAFKDCTGLKTVTFSNGITQIGYTAFQGCTALTQVYIPTSVTSIAEYAFENCTALTDVYYAGTAEAWNNMKTGWNDQYYKYLKNATLHAEACTGEHTYDNDQDADCNVCGYKRTIGGTTGDCTWTLVGTTLTISGNGAIGNYNLFLNDLAPWGADITSLIIEEGVTSIGNFAFLDCSSLASITIPDSVTSIGDWAFYDCASLTDITISDNVTSIGEGAFQYCSNLTGITIGDGVTSIGSDAFYNTGYYNNSSNWENDVLYIGNYLLYARTSISGSYTIKAGTITILDYAFYNCEGLTGITIPNSVTSIGHEAFEGCSSLTGITIGDGVTSIGWDAFSGTGYYNNSSNWENDALYIGNHLIKVSTSISGSYTIKAGTITIADFAFDDCYELTSITIPDSVTFISDGAFSGCSKLTSITIPDSVTFIGEDAFFGCSSLTIITIPDNVTSIGDWAFEDCTSLTSITIPDSVTSIGERAFYDCTSLQEAIYTGTQAQWDMVQVAYGNTALTNVLRVTGGECAHTYDNDYDADCNICGAEREVEAPVGNNVQILGNSMVCVDGTIELIVNLTDCADATSVAVELGYSDCFELVSTEWLQTGALKTFDTNTLMGALGGLESSNINGNLFKITLKATKEIENAEVSVRVIGKNDRDTLLDVTVTKAISFGIIGDLDGNGYVSDSDAVYLLMYTFFPDIYPVSQDCDYNNDGYVSDADAVYLLMYTFFPDVYPIG